MKKTLLISVSLSFIYIFFQETNAAWYGNTAVSWTATDTAACASGDSKCKICPADGDTTGGTPTGYPRDTAVTQTAGSLTPTPTYNSAGLNSNSNVTTPAGFSAVATTGTMYCLKWDGQAPTNPTSLTLTNVKNSNATACNLVGGVYYCKTSSISLTYNWNAGTDAGGSGLGSYQTVFQRASDSAWIINPFFTTTSGNLSPTSLADGTYYTWVQSVDNAGNALVTFKKGPNVVIDTSAPTASNITNANSTNILANNAYPYSITVGNGGGSPITSISATSENSGNETATTSRTSSNGTLSFNWNIQNVDTYRQANGGRQYTLTVTQICDAAGNCWNGTKTYNHNVYANTTTASITPTIVSTPLTTGNIADGTTRNLSVTVKDQYGNAIIPATGINRTIDFNWGVTNSLFLNQYLRSGTKSVFVNRTTDTSNYLNRLDSSAWFNGETSTNGTYLYGFKFYTPTANQDSSYPVSDTSANFSIDSLSLRVNGDIGSSTTSILSSTIPAKFNPLYSTAITGELKDGGFIEGAQQASNIALIHNGTTTPTGLTTYIKFGGTTTTNYDLFYSKTGNPTTSVSEASALSTNFGAVTSPINTLFSLVGVPTSNINSYLSTHIAYTLDGHSITYNSDIIGKDNYFGTYSTTQIANQTGVKILGNVSSSSNAAISANQIPNDVKILGDTDKFVSKTSIVKNGFTFAKNVIGYIGSTTLTNIDSPSSTWTEVDNVIYLGAESGNALNKKYQLGNGSNIGISTKKTILVIGGNLYIKSNLYYSNSNGMLGIIVLKDKQGNGGNVYIDPSVTNIVGSIFAEKSVISYDGTNELDGTTPVNTLKNQLHIYGNVFSENTIGGSRKTTPECPYYVPAASCTTKEQAQKYDLNYLRRYYLIDASLIGGAAGVKVPASNGKVIGGGTCSNTTGACTGGNTSFARNITNTNQSYSGNATLIEYNSRTQSSPPPLFTISN
ncbi:hypothetical protein COW06_03975 [Candidatus Gracilibacteria bacterium CG12_big_fil_rev_8_21_14_0_65_38_15]|nr:MAG: hypothetical protein COW68_02925 [Candidatus Gracilibacteria bacterium CG18_big_fil_WC_8_21_14_2_50_38_16]PIQ41136.1 MAG: hypothetical protein COW06_03975 [Candidatus Gracilibacteria bacterium CG12_big_fil_rev_8_21_14_0_65_38_15]PIZ02053.1 MAG: hypothetical protein COY60_00430 [Candidatus Gracilibacteria bacterium CG_4_10_14_0_8_um_filter_38_28]